MSTFDVVVPAGGKLDEHFARVALTDTKGLIKVSDGMLILKVLDALQSSGRINRIIVVGGDAIRDAVSSRVDQVVPAVDSLIDNVTHGIQALQKLPDPPARVLIATADMPYIEAKSVAKFLDMCPDADFCGALVSAESYIERFPGSTSTFANLVDGEMTMGGVYLVKVDAFRRALPKLREVIANRKSIPKMAKLLGIKFLWQYTRRQASVSSIESKVGEILGLKVKAVADSPPDLAFDIDEISDYEYALRNK